MYKTRDLIGKAVISVANGKQIGVVKDLICSWQEGIVTFIFIETGNILAKNETAVPVSHFKRFAGEWIPLVSLANIEDTEYHRGHHWTKFRGMKIISNWGREVGVLAEMIFSFPEGRIEYLEISDGLLKDFINGRAKVPYDAFETFTDNMIIIKEEFGGIS